MVGVAFDGETGGDRRGAAEDADFLCCKRFADEMDGAALVA